MLGIYTRLSKQDEDSNSIKNQLREGKKFAEDKGYDYDIYDEGEGVSGGADIGDRPQLSRLMDDIKYGVITSVWFRNQNRLERNSLTYAKFAQIVKAFKTKVYFDGIEQDFINPSSNLQGTILSALNQYTRELQGYQTKKSLRNNAIEGKAHGILPYGYSKDKKGYLIIDSEEAKIVKRIFKLSLQGIGINKIADMLNSDGVQTRYNKIGTGVITIRNKYDKDEVKKMLKKDVKWSGNSVYGILKNPIHKGVRIFQGVEYVCPFIFDGIYWDEVNDNLKKNANNSGRKVHHKYLLKGFLRCGKCGRNMVGRTRANKRDNFYYCSSKRNKETNCGNRSINIDVLDKYITSRFFGDHSLYRLVKEHFKSLNEGNGASKLKNDLKDLQSHLKWLKTKEDKLLDLYLNDDFPKPELNRKKNQLKLERQDLKLKIYNKEKQLSTLDLKSMDKVLEGLELKKSMSIDDKRSVFNNAIKNIEILFSDNLYQIKINYKIDGFKESKVMLDRNYKFYIASNDIKYYLKPRAERTTLDRVYNHLANDYLKSYYPAMLDGDDSFKLPNIKR